MIGKVERNGRARLKHLAAAMLLLDPSILPAANPPVPTDPLVISTDTAAYGKRAPDFTREITMAVIPENSIVEGHPRSTRHVISK